MQYDGLHRLESSTLNSVTNLQLSYEPNGNVATRREEGGPTLTYRYHASRIHAVEAVTGSGVDLSFQYDGSGNLINRSGATVSWFASGKPQSIGGAGGASSEFQYVADGRYWQQLASGPEGSESTLYLGGLIERVTSAGETHWRHHIAARGRTVAIYSRAESGASSTRYLLTDPLGSLEALTDESGTLLARASFAAFGARRASDWEGAPPAAELSAITETTRRGFTGHSMLDALALIHMNGRVYDPLIGRFLSADPLIQEPTDTQAWNRYSYTLNNPLSRTDPSGYLSPRQFLKRYWRPIVAIVAAVATYGALSGTTGLLAKAAATQASNAAAAVGFNATAAGHIASAATAASTSTAMVAGAAAGAVAGGITGGTRGLIAGAITGGLLGGIGAHYGNTWNAVRVVAEGAVGGLGSELSGGSFAEGFRLAAGYSVLRWGAYEMRHAMVVQSCTPPRNPNCSGVSAGTEFDGDTPRKIGGGRAKWRALSRHFLDPDRCRDPWRCIEFEKPSVFGGNQGQEGSIFGWSYQASSLADRVIESYAGAHDWLSSFRYGAGGSLIEYTNFGESLYMLHSAIALVPATPFAIVTGVPTTAFVPALMRGD